MRAHSPSTTKTLQEIRSAADQATAAMSRLDRDARLPAFIDVRLDIAARFRALRVAVIGNGSIGMHLVSHLARLAPAMIVTVDRARLKPASVLTHPIHPRDLGAPKALVAGELAKAVSPDTRVFAFTGDLADLPTAVMASLDCVLLATDNIAAEVLVSQRVLRLGIPCVQASVYGRSMSAVVRSVDGGGDGSGPGLCCGLQAGEWDALDQGVVFSCAPEDRAAGSSELPSALPTASTSHLCSLAGDLAFNEFFRTVAGLGKPGGHRTLEYCGYTNDILISDLKRRAMCPLDHTRDRIISYDGDLCAQTPGDLLRAADCGSDDRVSLMVEGHCFAAVAWCACDSHPVVGRFLANGETAGVCARCGTERSAHPLHHYSEVPARALRAGRDRSLASLGARTATAVRVRGDYGAVQFVARFGDPGVDSDSAGESSK